MTRRLVSPTFIYFLSSLNVFYIILFFFNMRSLLALFANLDSMFFLFFKANTGKKAQVRPSIVHNALYGSRHNQHFFSFFQKKNKFFNRYVFAKHFFFANLALKKNIFLVRKQKSFFLPKSVSSLHFSLSTLYSFIFLNWSYLVGFLISPYSSAQWVKDFDPFYSIDGFTLKKIKKKKYFFKTYLNYLSRFKKSNKKFNAKFFLNKKTKFLFFYKKLFFKNFFFLKHFSLDVFTFLIHFYLLKLQRKKTKIRLKNKPYSFFFNKKLGNITLFKLMHFIAVFKNYRKFYKFFKKNRLLFKKSLFQKMTKNFLIFSPRAFARSLAETRKSGLLRRSSFSAFAFKTSKSLANAPSFAQTSGTFFFQIYAGAVATRPFSLVLKNQLQKEFVSTLVAYSGVTPGLKIHHNGLKMLKFFFFLLMVKRKFFLPTFAPNSRLALRRFTTLYKRFSFRTSIFLAKCFFKRFTLTKFQWRRLKKKKILFRTQRQYPTLRNQISSKLVTFPCRRAVAFFKKNSLICKKIKNFEWKLLSTRSGFYPISTKYRKILLNKWKQNLLKKNSVTAKVFFKNKPTPSSTVFAKSSFDFLTKTNLGKKIIFFFLLQQTPFISAVSSSSVNSYVALQPVHIFAPFGQFKAQLSNEYMPYLKNFFFFKNMKTFTLNSIFTNSAVVLVKQAYFTVLNEIAQTGLFPNSDVFPVFNLNLTAFNKKFIFIYTKNKTNYVLSANAFILRTQFFTLSNLTKEIFYVLKKRSFSFSYKNEMENYIIKQYFKNKVVKSPILNASFYLKESLLTASSFNNKLEPFQNELLSSNLRPTEKFPNSAYLAYLPQYAKWSYLYGQMQFSKNFFLPFGEVMPKRVKFKPGYSVIWRKARTLLQTELRVKFRYQYRLTRFLVRFYKFSRINFFFFSELRLDNVLLKSKLLPEVATVNLFIANSLIYLNGVILKNLNVTAVLGDFVQLVVHNKYYILYRWLSHFFFQRRLFLKSKIHTKMTKKRNPTEDKQRSHTLPHWVLNNRLSLFDVPNYLEVDYFTLSFFLIYEPFTWIDVDPYHFINLRFGVLNTYNWKYIN